MARKKKSSSPDPLILYSTNSRLSLLIASRYYGDEHYVWCTPFFSASYAPVHVKIPPTSCPSTIYHRLWDEVKAGDRHSAYIKDNRKGNIQGAEAKLAAGIITMKEKDEIVEIINGAEVADFQPFVYLIPFMGAAHLLTEVPVAQRAHPLSVEYRILNLPRTLFEIIELRE